MTLPPARLVNASAPAQAIESSRFFDQHILLAFADISKAPSLSGQTHDGRPETNAPTFGISGFMASFGSDDSADAGNEPAPGDSASSGQHDGSDLPLTAASGLRGNLPPELAKGGSRGDDFVTPDGIWFDANEINETDFARRSPNDPRADADASGDEVEIGAPEADQVPVQNAGRGGNNVGGGGNNAGHENGARVTQAVGGAPANVGGAWCGTCLNITLGLMAVGILAGIGYVIADSVTGVPAEDPDTPYYPSNLEVSGSVLSWVLSDTPVYWPVPQYGRADGAPAGAFLVDEIPEIVRQWVMHAPPVELQELTLIGARPTTMS